MAHDIPDEMIVSVLADGLPAAGLAVQSELVMPERNNYTCIHGPTDESGCIRITADEITAAVELSLQVGLMDYVSLDRFTGTIVVRPVPLDRAWQAKQGYSTWHRFAAFPVGYADMLTTVSNRLADLSPAKLEAVVRSQVDGVRVVSDPWIRGTD